MNLNRVVITGLGAITPLGNEVSSFWENSIEGKSGSALITHFDPTSFKTKFACEVKNYDPSEWLTRNEIRKTDLFTQYALYASSEAIEDAGILSQKIDPYSIGVIWGTGQGGMTTFENEMKEYVQGEFNPRFSPFFIPKLISNMASGMVSIKFGFQGINYTTTSACATGNTSLMDAFNYIRLGKAKIIISGGSEAPITESSVSGFNSMKALSKNNENLEEASKPFDQERDGFVIGEGAGALVLEDYEHAKKRGAKIYAEIVGAAMTADAYHMSATHPEGLGAYHSMRLALEEAKLGIHEIDYINAHSTSTPTGDLSEIHALTRLVGKGFSPLVSATKSMTGHLLGAAGAIEAILCVKAITEGIVPPTINTKVLDPQIPSNMNIVLNTSMNKTVKLALNNAFGFGGHNATVIFKKV